MGTTHAYECLSELIVDVRVQAKAAERKLRYLEKVSAEFIEPIAIDDVDEAPREVVDTPLQAILKQRSLSRQSSAASNKTTEYPE